MPWIWFPEKKNPQLILTQVRIFYSDKTDYCCCSSFSSATNKLAAKAN